MDYGFEEGVFDRDRELELISASVASRRGRFVLIEGPAGIGKTTLLRAAGDVAVGRYVMTARGGELERDFAFGMVRQAFAGVLRDREKRERCLSGAAALASGALGVDHRDTAAGNIGQALHGLYWACVNLADEQPLLLAVDDLQWSDEESLRWLHHLVRRLADLAVVVIAAVRTGEPDAPEHLLTALREEADDVFAPGSLTEAGVAGLVRSRLGSQPSPAFVTGCRDVTSGNPFYLCHLLDAVQAAGLSTDDAAVSELRTIGTRRIRSSISSRIAGCGPAAVSLAKAIAILGMYPEARLVAEATGLTGEQAAHAAAHLVAADILRGTDSLDFVHPIVRSTVLAGISAPERERLHASVVRLLTDAGAPSDRVAAHLLHVPPAGDPEVVRILRDSASQALKLGAIERADRSLRRALIEPPERNLHGVILRDVARMTRARDPMEAADLFVQAVDRLVDPFDRAEAVSELHWIYEHQGHDGSVAARRTLLPLLDRTIRELPAQHEDLSLLLSYQQLFWQHITAGREHHLVEPIFQRMDELGASRFTRSLLDVRATMGHWGRREATAEQVMEDYRSYYTEAAIRADELDLIPLLRLCDCGRPDRAAEILAWIREAHAALGWSHARDALTVSEAMVALYGYGNPRRADQLLAETGGEPLGEAVVFLLTGLEPHLRIQQDRLDEAASALTALGMPLTGAVTFGEGGLDQRYMQLMERGLLQAASGEIDGAASDLMAVGKSLASLGLLHAGAACSAWRAPCTIALARLDRREEACTLGEETVNLARRWGARTVLGRSEVALGVAEGGDHGLRRIQAGVMLLETAPNLSERARGLFELGAELRRRGRRTEARQNLHRSAELAESVGFELVARLAREELRLAGGRVRKRNTASDELTPAEERVAALVVENRTNRQIAQTLFLSTKTVEMHVGRILRKLSISAREEIATALGLTPLNEDGSSTVMFTDIVGSTALNRDLGDEVWLRMLSRHNALVRARVHAERGIVIKSTGDGFMLAFRHPVAAARCALEIQRVFVEELTPGRQLEVRIGMHSGTPQELGGDLFGADVNLAARVCDRALAGQVLCSQATAALLEHNAQLSLRPAYTGVVKGLGDQTFLELSIRDPELVESRQ